MAALTVRRENHATGSPRLPRPLKCLFMAILFAAALPIQAQLACPMPVIGGNGQTTLAGTRFSIPLTVGQSNATAAMPPVFDVTWDVNAPNPPVGRVYIEESGTLSHTQTGITWSAPPASYSASINLISEPNANGVYTVQASTPTCSSAFSTFNINVVAPVLPQLNAFQGGSQNAITGTTFASPLGAFVSQGSGVPTPVANAKVIFTIDSGPARFANGLTNIPAFTDATGHAYVDLFANAGVLAPTNVSISVASLTAAGAYTGIQVLPAGAPTLTAAPPPSGTYTAPPNQQFAELFTLTLLDGVGLPRVGTNVTYQITGSSGAQLTIDGTFFSSPLTIPTDSAGASSVQVTAGSSGNFTLTATTAGFTPVVWNLTTSGASQSLAVVSGSGQTTAPSTAFPQPLVVQALVGGTAVSGVPVTYSVVSGNAYFLGGQGTPVSTITAFTSNPPATASVQVFAGTGAGESVVEVSAAGYQLAQFVLNIQAQGPETVIKVSGDAQQGPADTTLVMPLVAGVTPTALVNAAGAPILFEVISGGATFVESGTGIFSAVPGGSALSAAVSLKLGPQPGTAQIRASYPGMLPAVFTATGTAPTSDLILIKIAGDGQLATTGLESAPLRVRLNNGATPVAHADIDWTVLSGDATVSVGTTKTGDSGESETTVVAGSNTGSIRVRASLATLPAGKPATIVEFVLNASDAKLTAVAGSGQSGSIGSIADQVFSFELRGANSAILPGQTVSFATNDGTLTANSAVTGSDGRVSVGLRYGSNPGSVQVTARAFGTRVSAIGVASTFVPVLTIASGNNQTAAAGASLADPLVIQISQPPSAAKGLQGLVVNWSIVTGGGTLGSATSTTDSNGRASNTLRVGSTLGAQQVRASIAGVGEVLFSATSSIPANSVLEIVSGNNQQVVPRRPSAPLVVRLRTAAGAALSGFTVRFTPSSGATLDPGDVITGADGRAATVVSVTLPGDYTVTANLPAVPNIAPAVFNLGNGIANIPGLTGPAERIARAIDRACPRLAASSNLSAAQQDLLQRCSELVVNANARTGDVVNALDKMLADESSSQNNAALASASAQFENLKGRFAALRSGSTGINLGGLALMTADGRLPLSFLPSNFLLGAADGDQPAPVTESFARWGFFATGTIGRGSRDPADTDPGGDFNNYGLTAGVDYRLTDSFILGGALGFNRSDSNLNQNQGGLDSSGYSLSAYGTWFKASNYYADGVLTLGRNSTDITRRINYTLPSVSGGTTTINQIANGSPDSDQQSFALSFGRDFNRGALSFGPYLRGTYTKLNFDSYVERMSDPTGPGAGLALAVDERQLTSMQGVLGGKMSYAVSTSWGVLMPSLQVEYVKEFKDDPDGLVTRFAFDPTNTSFVIDGDKVDTDFLNIGLGLSGVFANGRSGYIYYEHVAGKDRTSQDSLAIGIRIEF